MKFSFSISYSMIFMFVLLGFLPITPQAETVYITDSLFIGLHKERSIDSEILKVLPTGAALEVIKRDGDFVNVRDPKGDTGWISSHHLISHDPMNNAGLDENSAHNRSVEEIEELKIENEKLRQQADSDKLKSGEMQVNLTELRNQISQNGSNAKLINKVKQLTEMNAQLQDQIGQLQETNNTNKSDVDGFKLSNPVVLSGITLLLGLLIGIIFMGWQEKQRYGGLRL